MIKRKNTRLGMLAAVILASGLALTACADPVAEQARIEAADHQNCLELGFKPNTDAYGNCRLKLREIRAKEGGYESPVHFGIGVGVGSSF